MIYGINFTVKSPGTDQMGFPPAYARRFRKVLRIQSVRYRLVGICESPEELRAMLQQADNGHRKLHVEVRKPLYGIYT